jgi:serine/threonine protein kinase
MPGKTIKNRYLIEDLTRNKLGSGAFGQVYLATDTEYRTDQKVVVKQLQPDYSNCRSIEERKALFQRAKNFFEREAKVLEKLGKVSDPRLDDCNPNSVMALFTLNAADRVGERSRTRSVADRQYPTPMNSMSPMVLHSLRQCYAIDQKIAGLVLLRHYQTSSPIGLPHSTSPSEDSVMPASNSSKLSSGKI